MRLFSVFSGGNLLFMPSKKYWEKAIFSLIKKHKNTTNKSSFKIQGYLFFALPEVFSPIYSSDTTWFAKKIVPITKNKTFLEIGTGTGVIACLAKMKGAKKVVATDINSNAIKNTKLNQKKFNLTFSVRKGNAFDPIKKTELFDIIFWNHPFGYYDNKNSTDVDLHNSVFDYKYSSLKIFFKEGKKHLSKNGKLFLGSSNVARINLIKKIAKENDYSLTLFAKTYVPVYKKRKIKMDLRIYQLDPI